MAQLEHIEAIEKRLWSAADTHYTRAVAGDRIMKEIAVLEDLRAVRRRLAQEQKLDVKAYAAMLREVAHASPGHYVTAPVLPSLESIPRHKPRSAG
jgi:hypothetical protein